MPVRLRLLLLLALLTLLLGAVPAVAGGFVQLDGSVLRFTGEDVEADSVTIGDAHGQLVLDNDASRMTAGPGCTASADGYHVVCPDAGIDRIAVKVGLLGSDVRIRADLPSFIQGGPGDDVLIGGPANDVIDGGPGQDIIGGGGGADVLRGGSGQDLVTYDDVVAHDGTLLPRRTPVTVAIGKAGASGGPGEGDTIASDVEQVQGGNGNDRFLLRDGRATSVSCGGGSDTVIADPRDAIDTDCENASVAPAPGGARMTLATLPFPSASSADRARSAIAVGPPLPLQHGAVVLHASCPPGIGLLEMVGAPPCSGLVRFSRSDGVAWGAQRVQIGRGATTTLRLPLQQSRALARRASGLTVIATALPDRGHVVRTLRFTVRG